MWRRIFHIIKWLLGIMVALMLLISALVLVFKDDIKSYVVEEANHYLNKTVHVGYIDVAVWSSFPDMAIQLEDVMIHSKFEDFQTKDTALYSRRVTLRFDPMDFLASEYNLHQIDVEDGVFNMHILEDGRVNYDFLKQREEEASSDFSLELEKINVANTRFNYRNDATQQDYATRIQQLGLSGSFNASAFKMQADADFTIVSLKNQAMVLVQDKSATCAVEINMDQINDVFTIESAAIAVNKIPFNLSGSVTADRLDFSVQGKSLELEKVANNLTLSQLEMVNAMNGRGTVDFMLSIEGPLSATTSPAIDAEFAVHDGALSDQGFQLENIQLNGSYTNGVNAQEEAITLREVRFKSMQHNFHGNARITDFSRPRIRGLADGTVDLAAVHRLFGPFNFQTLSGNVEVDGRFDVRLNNPGVKLAEMDIYALESTLKTRNVRAQLLDDQRIFEIPKGEITVRNQWAGFTQLELKVGASDVLINGKFNRIVDYFRDEGTLQVDADIASEYLALEDLSTAETTRGQKQWLLPRSIAGALQLDLDEVVYGGHVYEAIQTKMRFQKGALHFPYLKGNSAGATIKGDLRIHEDEPMLLSIRTNLSSEKVSFAPLFEEWNNFDQEVVKAENIEGDAAIDLTFQGSFDLYEGEEKKEDFRADASIKIVNGALRDVAAMKTITNSLKQSSAKLLLSESDIRSLEKKLLNLEFKTLENTLELRNGVLHIPRMNIASNALNVGLSGTHTFENVVDYSFDFRFRELKGQRASEFGDVVDDETGMRIYMKMKGPIEDPAFSWNKAAKKAAKKERREEAKEDLKGALKTGFGINKNDTTIEELQDDKRREEKLIMEFDQDSMANAFDEEEKTKKKNALQKQIDKWKRQNEEEKNQETFELDED